MRHIIKLWVDSELPLRIFSTILEGKREDFLESTPLDPKIKILEETFLQNRSII